MTALPSAGPGPAGATAGGPTVEQSRAIGADPGPTLVIAGPGAGKTYCLIGRIQWLIAKGVLPERILAVTFTNKAAGEIAHRLGQEVGGEGREVTRGTLHALCLRLLREFPGQAGLEPGFGVADEEYQLALLRGLRGLRLPEKRFRQLIAVFGRSRALGTRLDERDERIFTLYRRMLRRKNLLDFDDLILHAHQLLERDPAARQAIAGRWDAILVDEFQDLTPTQYGILMRLAEPHRHLFAVGDDEQSIYGFAGADPAILKRFTDDHDITPVVLEVNHRNSRRIFEVARRVLHANPSLFDKRLTASRESPYDVRALRFQREEDEVAWLIADLLADRTEHGLAWGEYAVLFRLHILGERLEAALLRAGIPVATARGRAIADDPVAGPVFAALRAIRDPRDRVPWQMLARRYVSPALQETLVSRYPDLPFASRLRAYGWHPDTPELEARRVRRLYYYLTNLPAMARMAGNLGELVDTLLEQRPSHRRTRLEEQAEDLADPEALPAVRSLGDELDEAQHTGGRIRLTPCGGLELALGGMLRTAGFTELIVRSGGVSEPGDLVLDLRAAPGMAFRLFKALQRRAARGRGLRLEDCVTFDLETTGTEIDRCGIVEIGAARVRGGEVVETFRTLIDPGMPIPEEATRVHGYRDADVAGAPGFAETWPLFRRFVGDDLLVAHNGREFDVPVLTRQIRQVGGDPAGLGFFDTLPLARAVCRGSARLSSLAGRYGVPLLEAHHALDDAVALAGVLRGLLADQAVFHRKTGFSDGLDWLGLALALERGQPTAEEELLSEIARPYTLGPYSRCLEQYATDRESAAGDAPSPEAVIEKLGGAALMARLRVRRSAADRFPSSVARLRRLLEGFESLPVAQGIERLLDVVGLARRDGAGPEGSALSLLTLHATKGLEFSRVSIVGVEDYEMPGYHAMRHGGQDEFPEARRLLYVGMTRARDRLVLTSAIERAGRGTGGTWLLDETRVPVERLSAGPEGLAAGDESRR